VRAAAQDCIGSGGTVHLVMQPFHDDHDRPADVAALAVALSTTPRARFYIDVTHEVLRSRHDIATSTATPRGRTLLFGSLAPLGARGAYCAGSADACQHQRLAVPGYCFSAALPAHEAAAAALRLTMNNE
jgi:7-keto-8-aminopelargonate synthetase-like enzyme